MSRYTPVTSVWIPTPSASHQFKDIIDFRGNVIKVNNNSKEMDKIILRNTDMTLVDSVRARTDTQDLITEIVTEPYVYYNYNFNDNQFTPTVRFHYRETIPFLPAVPHDSNFPPLSHYQYRRIPYFSSVWLKSINYYSGVPQYTAYWNGRIVYSGTVIGEDDWVQGTDGHYYFIGERNNTYHRDVQSGSFTIARNTAMPEVYARTGMPRRPETTTDFIEDLTIITSRLRTDVSPGNPSGDFGYIHSSQNVLARRAPDIDLVDSRLTVLDTIMSRLLDDLDGPVDEATRIRLRSSVRILQGTATEIRRDLNIT